ncbi:hypothetical protein ACJMK2_035928 [Sinanodonta woodiana]|uniref:Uncharacterized protein n=1 Tax=Sinanodonta woodiana TaxID=1069815 RepID=A0ABD3WJ16_SINWO
MGCKVYLTLELRQHPRPMMPLPVVHQLRKKMTLASNLYLTSLQADTTGDDLESSSKLLRADAFVTGNSVLIATVQVHQPFLSTVK